MLAPDSEVSQDVSCHLPLQCPMCITLLSVLLVISVLSMQVFSKWHNQKKDAVRKQQEEAIAERKRKGILSGREIFAQVRPCAACCHLLVSACRLVWLILTKLQAAVCF